MERMVEKKTESLTREELLEACDILRSIQKECEGQASDPADGLSEAQHDGKASFYKKQAADIEHLIGTVQQMAENSSDGKEGAGKERLTAEGEVESFVRSITDGMILGVNWEGIQEMLGENKQRLHLCTLHTNTSSFPSAAERERSFTEEQIKAILCQGNPRWMKEVYENGDFLKPISVRYFAVDKPKSEGWLDVPGASASK